MPSRRETTYTERSQIILLSKEGYNASQIHKKLGFPSERQIRSIIQYYRENNTVEYKSRPGRPRKTSTKEDTKIISIAKSRKMSSIKNFTVTAKKALQKNLSHTTVWKRVKESGAKKRRERRKPKLSEKNIQDRLDFATKYKRKKWDNVVFSDECMVQLYANSVQVWSWDKNDCVVERPKHVPKRMFWACFDINGVSELVEVEGRMNSKKYCEVLEQGLLPFLEKRKNMGSKGITFQQDNATSHTAKATMNWLYKKKIKVLDWPANSPEWNPSENLWSTLKKRIQEREPKNIDQVIAFAKEEWKNMSVQTLKNLVQSMPSRLAQVVQNKGRHTNY